MTYVPAAIRTARHSGEGELFIIKTYEQTRQLPVNPACEEADEMTSPLAREKICLTRAGDATRQIMFTLNFVNIRLLPAAIHRSLDRRDPLLKPESSMPDLQLFASLGITAGAGRTLAHFESTKTH